jgi:hypothetical protein
VVEAVALHTTELLVLPELLEVRVAELAPQLTVIQFKEVPAIRLAPPHHKEILVALAQGQETVLEAEAVVVLVLLAEMERVQVLAVVAAQVGHHHLVVLVLCILAAEAAAQLLILVLELLELVALVVVGQGLVLMEQVLLELQIQEVALVVPHQQQVALTMLELVAVQA